MAQCNHKRNTLRVNHGMDAKSNMDKYTVRSTVSRSKNGRTNDQKTTCARLYQSRATTYGTKGKINVHALSTRHNDVARRGKLANPLPYIKTRAKAIQTFSHQTGLIRRNIRIRTPASMEDPPSVPCQPPNSI